MTLKKLLIIFFLPETVDENKDGMITKGRVLPECSQEQFPSEPVGERGSDYDIQTSHAFSGLEEVVTGCGNITAGSGNLTAATWMVSLLHVAEMLCRDHMLYRLTDRKIY